MPNARETRRICGFVASRADRLRLDRVSDHRDPRGKRWNLPTLLWASLLGMMAGQKSFAGVESLTDDLSVSVRRRLGIKRRVPDTSLRNALATIDPAELRPVLHSGTNNAPKLDIADVEVSVRPDVILRGTYHGKKVVGALKFHFAKTSPLVQDASANVAVLLQRYCETHVREDGETVSARHCAVLDVFSQKWMRSPRATQLRLRTIEAACQQIRLWWAAA